MSDAELDPLRNFSGSKRFRILERDNFSCVYCGATPDIAELRLDHVVPWSKGGRTEPDNLVTACHKCNSGKKAKVLAITSDERLAEIREKMRINAERYAEKVNAVTGEIHALEDVAGELIAKRQEYRDVIAAKEQAREIIAAEAKELKKLIKGDPRDEEIRQLCHFFGIGFEHEYFFQRRSAIKKVQKDLSFDELIECAEIVIERGIDHAAQFNYFMGVCRNKIKAKDPNMLLAIGRYLDNKYFKRYLTREEVDDLILSRLTENMTVTNQAGELVATVSVDDDDENIINVFREWNVADDN